MNTTQSRSKRWARWLGTFVGFPLAGVAARAVAGNIDAPAAAVIGGLAGGAVLGAVQVGIGGIDAAERLPLDRRAPRPVWPSASPSAPAPSATDTDTASLVAMGAICGAARRRRPGAVGPDAPRSTGSSGPWPPRRCGRGGWLITSQVIVDADRQHAIFGSSGALAVSALAGVLYATRVERPAPSPLPSPARSSDRWSS